MKLKEGFILRKVAGQNLVLPSGGELDPGLMITLNETGALLWQLLEQGSDADALTAALLAEYDVDEATARANVEHFTAKLKRNGLLV